MSVETIGAVTAGTSAGTLLTANAAANTKGSYAELSASTSAAADGFLAMPTFGSANDDFLYDIATGAGGAETVVVADAVWGNGGTSMSISTAVPLGIASSTRVAARCQDSGGSGTMRLSMYLWAVGATEPYGCTAVDTYGANTADSGGVEVDPGGSANTKGSYAEVTGSTSAATEMVGVGIANKVDIARSTAGWLLDIATGAAASETVVLANVALASSSIDDVVLPPMVPLMPLVIANATRVAARAQCTITTAGDRLFDVVVYGARGADAVGGGSGGGAHILGGTVVR